jgi:hypothetical protein
LAAIPPTAFVLGLAIGNALFISAHFGLGFLLGEPILAAVGGALGPLAIAGVVLALLGSLGWFAISRRRTTAKPAPATLADWADACCPACLTLAALGRTAD